MASHQNGQGASSSSNLAKIGKTEFDVLKASHRFLRPEGEDERSLSWNDQVAKKYYSNLYREFAICNLKHYKSGNFSLRWRTEDEVISGAGETTCGNTRCHFHMSRTVEEERPTLTTLELPFSYTEDGENKLALVKVVLCDGCVKKLMYKRNKEKGEQAERNAGPTKSSPVKEEPESVGPPLEEWRGDARNTIEEKRSDKRRHRKNNIDGEDTQRQESPRHHDSSRSRRPRSSRSRSPTRARNLDNQKRRSP